MIIKEISITYGGKLNMGDYNSAHIEMTVSALIEESDNVETATAQLMDAAKTAVRTEARALFAKRGARVDEIFCGLPVEAQQQINGGSK